jgi:surface protein
VTTMASMFNGCTGLQHLNVSGFDTRNVTSMSSMFGGGAWTSNGCSSLTELDLSSFDTQRVTVMSYMFKGCGSMETIYVSDAWTTDAVTSSSSMFTGCTNIRGGKGTTWNDENPKDKTYARIDGGQSTPGYLTKKIDYLLGDVNGDGKVDVADITALTNHLKGTTGNFNSEAADVDGSGKVTSDDVPALVNKILGK